MPIEAALFFDNDLGYCSDFAPWADRVTPFHIGGSEEKNKDGIIPITPWAEMRHFKEKLSKPGKYVFEQIKYATEQSFEPAQQGDLLDETSGLTFPQAQVIFQSLQRKASIHGAANVAAIFDFDRTLSLFEGFIGAEYETETKNPGINEYLQFLNEIAPIVEGNKQVLTTAEGLIDYMFGGPDRVNWLHGLFHTIRSHGHPLVILTNNKVALKRPKFLMDFFPDELNYPGFTVICGSKYKTKPLALNADPAFTHLFQSKPLDDGYIIRFSRDAEHAPLLHKEFTDGKHPPMILGVDQLFPLPGNGSGRKRATRRRNRKQSRRRKN